MPAQVKAPTITKTTTTISVGRIASLLIVPPFLRSTATKMVCRRSLRELVTPYIDRSSPTSGDSQDCGQPVVVRVWVAGVLAEGFAVFHADFFAAGGGPAFAVLHVFVDAVLLAEPVALAFVAGQHFLFCLKRRRHVDDEVGF